MLERFDETDCKCGLPVPVEASPEGALVRYADAQATIADLQGQLLEWKRALHSLTPGGSEYANDSKACVEWVREARSRQHEAIIDGVKQRKDLQQRVAQLEAWQDGVVKAFVEAPLEWSPSLGVPHIPICLPQIFKNMKDDADRLTTLQADHARVLQALVELVPVAENLINGLECDHDVEMCCCGDRRTIAEARASLPAQPAQGLIDWRSIEEF